MKSRSKRRLFGERVRKPRACGLFVERLEDRVVLDAGPLADSSLSDTASDIGVFSATIDVDLPKGGDSLLPDDSAADDLNLGGSAAGTANMSLLSSSDSSLPFTQFARLEMPTAPANPWNINLSLNPTAGLSEGDVLYVSFYARGERFDLGDAVEAKAYIQESATNTKLLTIPVAASSSWKRFSAKIDVGADLNTGEYSFVLHAGFAPQKIDIGGLVIQNYGRLGHRLADYTVTVQDRNGQPLPEATLDIEMVKHGFKFGTQVRDHLFAVSEAEFNAMSDTQKTALTPNLETSFGIPRFVPTWQDIVNHRTIVRDNFNHVVPTTGLQWIALENNGSSIPDAAIQEAAVGEQTVTAASVVWQKDRWPTPEAYRSTSNPDPQAFHDALVAARLGSSSVLRQFSDTGSGPTINDWKLLNEPLHEDYYQQVFVDASIYSSEVEALADYFKLADAVRPDATLSINEYNVINSANDNFAIQYRDLVQSLLDAGAPIDRVGIQAHISRNDISKEDIVRRLDILAETGLPIEISEFDTRDDAATPQLNETQQEQMFRDILEASFEHPSVDGFILWGIWDKVHWRGNAPLYDADWNIKAEAAPWFDLVRDEWQPDIAGQPVGRDGHWDAPIGLYHGTYEITAEANGVSSTNTVTIVDDSNIVITVDTEAAVDPSVIIASGSSLTETELRAGYLHGDSGVMYVSFDSSLSAEHESWWHEVLADVDQIIEPDFAIVPPGSSLSQLTIYQLETDYTPSNSAGVYIGPSVLLYSDGTIERTSEARIELAQSVYSHSIRFAESDEAGWKSVAYHELGHALGLEHPHDADDGDVDTEVDTNVTIMSYNQIVDEDGDPGFTPFDVEALTSIHGVEAGVTETPAEGTLLLDLGPFDTTQTWKTPSLRMEWVDGSFVQEPVAGTVTKTLELTRYDGFTGNSATVFLDWGRDESGFNWHWGNDFSPSPGFHDMSFGDSYPNQINFAAGQISATVEITVIGDTVEEGSEWLDVTTREARSPGYFQTFPTEAVRLTVIDAEELPALDAISNLSFSQDDESQVVLLSGIAAGVGEPRDLRVMATSSDPNLVPHPIETYTSPNATGSLTVTPAANQHGTATITVTVEDGGVDGNLETVADNTSVGRTFDVTIEPVNYAPVLDLAASPSLENVAEDSGEPIGPVGTLVSSLIDSVVQNSVLEFPASALPGTTIGNLPLSYEVSGLTWHEGLQKLFTVSDEGIVSMMNADGTNLVNWNVPGDLEALTVADHTSDLIYIGVENPDSILEFDTSTGQVTRTFDLTNWMTGADNQGLEALAFVPDATHPEGGLFYAGLQSNGRIYQFDLPIVSSSSSTSVNFVESLVIESGSTDLAGLAYESSSGLLLALFDSIDQINVIDQDGSLRSRWTVPGAGQEAVVLVDGRIYVGDDTLRSIKLYEGFDLLVDARDTHNNFSDADGDLPGVAITGVNLQDGLLWFSSDDGETWLDVGTVSEASPRLLSADADSRLYYQPVTDFAGTVSDVISFKAWDRNSTWQQLGLNIDGEATGDYSGGSISLSADGQTLAIGAEWNNNGNGDYSGHTRIYRWTGSAWNQLGFDIDGEAAGDRAGSSVSLSGDGQILAIGAEYNNGSGENSGHTRVYQWTDSAWSQLGEDIDGEAEGDKAGSSVSLSGDGQTLAVGAHANDGNGSDSGHTRIYRWTGSTWSQLGEDIDGEAAADWSGQAVALSADGQTVAIGAKGNDENGQESGHTRVFRWTGSEWSQLGADIDGEDTDDVSGYSVSLSADGQEVVIGAPEFSYDSANDANAGRTRIYRWSGTAWLQLGEDINGDAAFYTSGSSVSLSANSQIVAIGDPSNQGNAGHARIYRWTGTAWSQLGSDLDGEAANDYTGSSIFLSADGQTVAIGSYGSGSNSGQVRIFKLTPDAPSLSTLTDTISVTVEQVNDQPTLDAITSITILEDAAQQAVALKGISEGNSETQLLRVTATSSDTSLIPNPTVTYASPDATGSIAFTPVADQHGTATITVTVEDGGDDDNLTTTNDNATTTQTFEIIVFEVLPYEGELPLAQNAHGQLHVGLTPVSLGQQPVPSNILGFQALGAENDGSQKSLLVGRTNYLGEDVSYRLMTDSDWGIDDIFNSLRNRASVVLERPTIFDVSYGAGFYTIDLQQNPTLNVERGKTYILNLNVAGHPFYLQTTTGSGYQEDDVYAAGFDGNGQVTGSYIWTVPLDAPDELFYQCKFHAGMNGKIIISGPPSSGD